MRVLSASPATCLPPPRPPPPRPVAVTPSFLPAPRPKPPRRREPAASRVTPSRRASRRAVVSFIVVGGIACVVLIGDRGRCLLPLIQI